LRTIRTTAEQTVMTLYDQGGNMLVETDGEGNALREFAYLDGRRISLFDYTMNPEVYVEVYTSSGVKLSEVPVYGFDDQNQYTGLHAETDENGIAIFQRADFGPGSYSFRVDYLSGQFWSIAEIVKRADTITVVIEEEAVEITVTLAGELKAGQTVYLCDKSGNYLGLFAITDSEGKANFTLPEGVEYLFRTDMLGNQYWSEPVTVSDGGSVTIIPMGGGYFSLYTGETGEQPLTGLSTHLFNARDEYLGLSAVGNEQGVVSYLVPEGDYKIRVDYLGYPYWSATLHVDQSLSASLLIPHQDVEIGVELLDNKGRAKDLPEVPLTLYTPNGEELGVSTYSDFKGKALFHLPEREYTVAASYQEQLFYSAPFTWQDTTISIQSGLATVAVTSLESPLKDVMVTVCKTDTSELALHDATDGKGEVGFQLVPGDYLFRVDYQGHEYWSSATSVVAFGESDVFIEVGGGGFVLTLLTDDGLPLEKVETFLSTGDGMELNQSALTDKNGQVSYELAAGSYILKINYLGTTYWSEPIESPAMSELTHIIDHRPVEVSAKRVYQGDEQALKNLQVRLFTPDGLDLKLSEKIGKDYAAHFSLPEQDFIYQVEYLSQLIATGPSAESAVELVIPEGMGVVTVVADDTPLGDIPVSVFSETGTELGISGITDQNGEISFRLPVGLYQFRAAYNASTYQATGAVIA
ncbi:MAG: hypothetical protein OEV64_15580, partial [Desulfobulbaceae bacterium]|nr:hypothetical protein [Desulfobulbaceae bacterium]